MSLIEKSAADRSESPPFASPLPWRAHQQCWRCTLSSPRESIPGPKLITSGQSVNPHAFTRRQGGQPINATMGRNESIACQADRSSPHSPCSMDFVPMLFLPNPLPTLSPQADLRYFHLTNSAHFRVLITYVLIFYTNFILSLVKLLWRLQKWPHKDTLRW